MHIDEEVKSQLDKAEAPLIERTEPDDNIASPRLTSKLELAEAAQESYRSQQASDLSWDTKEC